MIFTWFSSSSPAPTAAISLREAALAGDAEAQHELAKELIESEGDENDVIHWLRQSSAKGYLPAMLLLAVRLFGIKERFDEVRDLLGIFSLFPSLYVTVSYYHTLHSYFVGSHFMCFRGSRHQGPSSLLTRDNVFAGRT